MTDIVDDSVKKMLEDDLFVPPSQYLVALSVVGPEEPQRCDRFAIKVRGVFSTREEADVHIRRLKKYDDSVHIYIADVGKWLVLPPPKDKIQDQKYQDEFLDKTFTAYQENQMEGRRLFEQRKRDVMRDGIDKHLSEEEKIPRPEEKVRETRVADGEVVGPAQDVGDVDALNGPAAESAAG